MYDVVKTGPIYEQAVQRMSTYRSIAARMGNARGLTQGKQDKKLERLGELIGETLAQLTDDERMALDCWRAGIMPDTYEVDHAALTDKPYVSIRKVERWTEEYDVDERKAQIKQVELDQAQGNTAGKARLRSFINQLNERL
jgi:hypothetical protein